MFLYLTQTEEKTKLSEDNAITTLIIAAAYYVACTWAFVYQIEDLNPVNPAIALGDGFGKLLAGKFSWNSWLWMYYVFPLVGAVVAVLLFETVFKKAAEKLNENRAEEVGSGL